MATNVIPEDEPLLELDVYAALPRPAHTFMLCAAAEFGDCIVQCECGDYRPANREHGYEGPR